MAIVTYKTLGQVRSGWVNEKVVITSRSITANVATVNTATSHGLVVGDQVYNNGIGGVLDGYRTVTGIPTSTQFTFGTSSASAASITLPSAYCLPSKTGTEGVSVTNILRTSNILTVTTGASHSCLENEYVIFSAGNTAVPGTYKILDAPTSTTFRAVSFGSDVASTALAAGLGATTRLAATTIYQPASNVSALIASLNFVNNGPLNTTFDLYQTPSTAWSSLSDKNKYLLQSAVILAPYETYSLNLAITIGSQDKLIMCANMPTISVFAYGTDFS